MWVCQNTQVVRPEGAEAPSPGQRPGCNISKAKRPVRAKAFLINAFALTGRFVHNNIRLPRALPWARCNLGFAFPLRAGDLWFSPHYWTFIISASTQKRRCQINDTALNICSCKISKRITS